MPDAENPPPKESESTDEPTVPTDIPTSEFHERADQYLNDLVQRLEETQEKDPSIEVDYSVRQMHLHAPSPHLGRFIKNTSNRDARPASSK